MPVLDLRAGRAVLARRGVRHRYAPVRSVLVPECGDALALARALRDRLGCEECYVADLDAVGGGPPQRALVRALAALGGRLAVDAAVATPARARETAADGARWVVVALETLPRFAALAAVVRELGRERVVFSLDLRRGRPVTLAAPPGVGGPLQLAGDAVRAGAGAVLVLDLARIGTGVGVDLALVAAVRRAHQDVEVWAGGGVGGRRDLDRLADAGCDRALVATALHDGRLGVADLAALR